MQTVCGSAAATGESTESALGEAVARARAAMGDREPDLCLVFASPRHPLQNVTAEASRLVKGTVLACSTAGEMNGTGLTNGGIAVFLVSWGSARHAAEALATLDGGAEAAADRLTAGYRQHAAAAHVEGLENGITLVFGDGLSPVFEGLVAKMRQRLPVAHGVVGGGAGDDGLLERTFVGVAGAVASSAAVAVHVASATPWGVGVGHGAGVASEPMTVTRANGNVVHELDGRPTLEVYRELAEREGVSLDDEAALRQFLVEYELGVYLFDDIARVRAGIATLPDGSVAFAGEVPEGASVSFVHGSPERYVQGARDAALLAREALGDQEVAGVLAISCITRGIVLGDRFEEEIAAIRAVFGDVPVGGFLSYGEVARVPSRLDGYHNNSLVVVAIPR